MIEVFGIRSLGFDSLGLLCVLFVCYLCVCGCCIAVLPSTANVAYKKTRPDVNANFVAPSATIVGKVGSEGSSIIVLL